MYIVQNKQPKKEIKKWDEMLFGDLLDGMFPKHPVGSMKTDISEYEDKYLLEVEMPGYDKKDISIALEDGYLTITATKKRNEDNTGKYIKQERFIGTTTRNYYVGDVEKDKIEASYTDGILKVELPKEEPKVEEKKFINIK